MIDKELHLALINRALSKGGEYADVFVEHRRHTSLVLEDRKLEKITNGTDYGTGIRLIARGKTSYAFSNDITKESLLRAAAEVSRAAEDGTLPPVMDLKTRVPAVDFPLKYPPEDIPVERKISLVRDAEIAARSFDDRIKQVTVIYRDSLQRVQIATSDGFLSEDERVYTTFIIQVVAAQEDIIQTAYESAGGLCGFELFEDNDLEMLSLKAAKRALMMLSARKAPGGRMPAVISSNAGGTMIHEAIGHGLEADLSQQGLSVFSNKSGARVASSLISVIDDATLPGKRGSFRFDDEGTPSQRTVLVEHGILKSYMYDKLSAMKDSASATGNGRRESYQHRPIPRMTNTFISQGSTPAEQILRFTEKGLFVEKMGGGQVNTVTGDFVFDVQEGYLIEKGRLGDPVRGATLTGNGPQILQLIDMVGDDLGFSIGTCGKDAQGVPVTDAMPTLRIPEIIVGGACK
ncbi:MAG: TldD/PmbA family protein [Nitrospirota bacterium]|nr:TldD/PmbA family protein [Nitrospirota bacterium]